MSVFGVEGGREWSVANEGVDNPELVGGGAMVESGIH